MTELGIEIEGTELIGVTEVTEECQGGMPDVTTMTDHHEEIEICLKVEAIVAAVVDEAVGVIAMSLPCKWEGETGKRAPAPHRKRKSLLLI